MMLTAKDIMRLSPDAQAQIIKALGDKRSKAKYGNTKTVVDGIRFDSAKEAKRYNELMLLLQALRIHRLKLQPEFTLQEAYTTPDGRRVRAIRYRADFSYEKDGKLIVEDVKGVMTDVYKQKRKMMLDKYGIEIQEV